MFIDVIETKRLVLRNFRSDDWERVHIYGSDPDFSKYEAWGPNSVDDTKKFISEMVRQASERPRYQFNYAICLKDPDLLIGGCGIRREAELSPIANMGWAVNPEFQSKGYATEAATALIRFGFDQLQLKLIYATCDARNQASYKVMEKLGMKRVGVLKGDRMQKGVLRDTLRYELIQS